MALKTFVVSSFVAVAVAGVAFHHGMRRHGCCHGSVPAATVAAASSAVTPSPAAVHTGEVATAPSVPLVFVPNLGQFSPEARFHARAGSFSAFLVDDGFRFRFERGSAVSDRTLSPDPASLTGTNVFLSFERPRAGAASTPVGEKPLPTKYNYYLGQDPTRWVTDVPSFGGVRYAAMYPGVDVVVHEAKGRIEYDLEVKPGADLGSVSVRVDGTEPLSIDASGALCSKTPLAMMRQVEPLAREIRANGTSKTIPCRFRLIDANHFGFEVDREDPTAALLVDPTVEFAGFVGGSGLDVANGVATDSAGSIYVCGRTSSPNLPTTPGAYDTTLGSAASYDCFFGKIDASGTAWQYLSYLGGTGSDYGEAIAVDAQGSLYIVGECATGFPVTSGAYDTSFNGQGDVFVTKVVPAGNQLVYSTFFGGNFEDRGRDIAVDATGAVTVCGQTLSTSFPTTAGAVGPTSTGGWDAFVFRLNPVGNQLAMSTRLGGPQSDWAFGVALDIAGNAFVCGGTNSPTFPTTPGAFSRTLAGGYDGFVAKVNPAGSALIYCTLLGGTGNDQAFGIDVDAAGTAFVTGTAGLNFPTTAGAYRTTGDGSDVFVTRLQTDGGSLIWSTYIGGYSTEQGNDIAVDAAGRVHVVGWTNSPDFPTTRNAFDTTFNGGGSPGDTFLIKLNDQGSQLIYGTYFGGGGYDEGIGLALSPDGAAIICGGSNSPSIPLGSGTFGTLPNQDDGFIARIELPPSPYVATYGHGCGLGSTPTLNSTFPTIGRPVNLSGTLAPPFADGMILLSGVPPGPLQLSSGCVAYWDLPTVVEFRAFTTDANGTYSVTELVETTSVSYVGATFRVQSVFTLPNAPLSLAVSNALEVRLGF